MQADVIIGIYYITLFSSYWENILYSLTFFFTLFRSKLDKLREELDQTCMVKIAESDKLQTVETKLHETGVQSEIYKNKNMQLRLKLEEIQHKLQAGTFFFYQNTFSFGPGYSFIL